MAVTLVASSAQSGEIWLQGLHRRARPCADPTRSGCRGSFFFLFLLQLLSLLPLPFPRPLTALPCYTHFIAPLCQSSSPCSVVSTVLALLRQSRAFPQALPSGSITSPHLYLSSVISLFQKLFPWMKTTTVFHELSPLLIFTLFSHLLLLVNYYLLDLDACKWFSQRPAVLGELEFYVYLFLSSK